MILSFVVGEIGQIAADVSSQVKLYYDRRSVGKSVLVSGTNLGPAINFLPSFFNYFWSVTNLMILGALSDEKSSL
jgi:hypothetical protein